MTDAEKTTLEAAVFRKLVTHLQDRSDVQNIDLMILAGFCRNCLSKWMVTEAEQQKIELDIDSARNLVYGMPYDDWKAAYQTEATAEQTAAFAATQTQKKSA